MDKRFLAILAGIIVIFIGVFVISSSGKDKDGSTSGNQKPTSHIKGEGQKKVTVMEYGDFQCPACKQFEPLVRQVYSKFSKDIFFQFRNLPLTIHQNARAAAKAAEAAALQNKYWEMHDILYDNQDAWAQANNTLSLFKTYAEQIGLNVNKFSTDFASSQVNAAINADITEFNKTGQEMSTPSFFINGKHITNDDISSVESFTKAINDEIKKQQ